MQILPSICVESNAPFSSWKVLQNLHVASCVWLLCQLASTSQLAMAQIMSSFAQNYHGNTWSALKGTSTRGQQASSMGKCPFLQMSLRKSCFPLACSSTKYEFPMQASPCPDPKHLNTKILGILGTFLEMHLHPTILSNPTEHQEQNQMLEHSWTIPPIPIPPLPFNPTSSKSQWSLFSPLILIF